MGTEFITPPGRIVWGHPLNKQKRTNDQGQPILNDDGEQTYSWSFGLAVPKDQCEEIFAKMQEEAASVFPNGAPQNFAWKYRDGDTELDAKGNPLRDKPGQAGCYIFSFATFYEEPPFYVYDFGAGQYVRQESGVKTGDIVRVMANFVAHHAVNNLAKPGLYLNPNGILFHQQGEEIRSGAPNPNALNIAPPPEPVAPMNAAPPGGAPGGPPAAPAAAPQAPAAPAAPAAPTGAPGGPPGTQAPGVNPAHQEFAAGPKPPGQ